MTETTPCVGPHDERKSALSGLLLCGRHRKRLDDDVPEIGLLIVDSQRIVDGGAPQDSGPRGGKVKKRADPPAPGDIAIMTLWDKRNLAEPVKMTRPRNWNANTGRLESNGDEAVPAVLAVVASWLLLVANEIPLTEMRHRSELRIARNRATLLDIAYVAPMTLPKSVLGQLDLLKRHHEWLAAQPFVDDYLLELAELRKALTGVVRDRSHIRVGVCDLPTNEGVCGGALVMENGSDTVECKRCHQTWSDPRERARLAMRL